MSDEKKPETLFGLPIVYRDDIRTPAISFGPDQGAGLRMRHDHGDRRHFTETEALNGCPECAQPPGVIYATEEEE